MKRSPWHGQHHELGNPVALFHFVVVRRVEIHERHHYFTAVPGVDEPRCVDAGDAVFRRQTAPRQDESPVTFGNGNGHAGRHHNATAAGRNTRVVVVNHREIPAGLMVDEVLGFRRFAEAEFNAEAPPTVIRCDSYLAGAFRRGGEVWPVLSLKSLVESQSFLQAAS